jgi:5-formyltetrahydrofolate cyclo-ligase
MSVPVRPGPLASKAEWRQWAKHRWAGVDVATASAAVLGHLGNWEPIREATTVLLYLPMPGELDIEPLTGVLEATTAVTRTPPEGPLTVHPLGGSLERHPRGFLQPVADTARIDPSEIEIALVPGRCFDVQGMRLGRGAGYYDVLLAALSDSALRVGVIPQDLVTPELPAEAHDIAMTHLVTEGGLVDTG